MSSNLLQLNSTWSVLDPGGASIDRIHLEKTFNQVVAELNLHVDFAGTIQVEDSWLREAIFFSGRELSCEAAELINTTVTARLKRYGSTEHINYVVEQVRNRKNGRFFRFPSSIQFYCNSVAELLCNTAIESIVAIGKPIDLSDMVLSLGFVRPIFNDEKLTLFVEEIYSGEFAPIEKETPHRCCGDDH